MWEYIIGYGPAGAESDALFVIEECNWSSRAAMLDSMGALGWECIAIEPHRPDIQRFVFRRQVNQHAEAPRHLLPCW